MSQQDRFYVDRDDGTTLITTRGELAASIARFGVSGNVVAIRRHAVVEQQAPPARPSFTNKELAEIIAKSLRGLSPREASSRLGGGFIAHLLARIPEDQWRGMLNDAPIPCGVTGCECEGLRIQVMEALDALREDFRKQVQSYGGQT